jgi:hypothetical protein
MGSIESGAQVCVWYSLAGAIFLFVLGETLISEYKYISLDEEVVSKIEAGYICLWSAAIYLVLL